MDKKEEHETNKEELPEPSPNEIGTTRRHQRTQGSSRMAVESLLDEDTALNVYLERYSDPFKNLLDKSNLKAMKIQDISASKKTSRNARRKNHQYDQNQRFGRSAFSQKPKRVNGYTTQLSFNKPQVNYRVPQINQKKEKQKRTPSSKNRRAKSQSKKKPHPKLNKAFLPGPNSLAKIVASSTNPTKPWTTKAKKQLQKSPPKKLGSEVKNENSAVSENSDSKGALGTLQEELIGSMELNVRRNRALMVKIKELKIGTSKEALIDLVRYNNDNMSKLNNLSNQRGGSSRKKEPKVKNGYINKHKKIRAKLNRKHKTREVIKLLDVKDIIESFMVENPTHLPEPIKANNRRVQTAKGGRKVGFGNKEYSEEERMARNLGIHRFQDETDLVFNSTELSRKRAFDLELRLKNHKGQGMRRGVPSGAVTMPYLKGSMEGEDFQQGRSKDRATEYSSFEKEGLRRRRPSKQNSRTNTSADNFYSVEEDEGGIRISGSVPKDYKSQLSSKDFKLAIETEQSGEGAHTNTLTLPDSLSAKNDPELAAIKALNKRNQKFLTKEVFAAGFDTRHPKGLSKTYTRFSSVNNDQRRGRIKQTYRFCKARFTEEETDLIIQEKRELMKKRQKYKQNIKIRLKGGLLKGRNHPTQQNRFKITRSSQNRRQTRHSNPNRIQEEQLENGVEPRYQYYERRRGRQAPRTADGGSRDALAGDMDRSVDEIMEAKNLLSKIKIQEFNLTDEDKEDSFDKDRGSGDQKEKNQDGEEKKSSPVKLAIKTGLTLRKTQRNRPKASKRARKGLRFEMVVQNQFDIHKVFNNLNIWTEAKSSTFNYKKSSTKSSENQNQKTQTFIKSKKFNKAKTKNTNNLQESSDKDDYNTKKGTRSRFLDKLKTALELKTRSSRRNQEVPQKVQFSKTQLRFGYKEAEAAGFKRKPGLGQPFQLQNKLKINSSSLDPSRRTDEKIDIDSYIRLIGDSESPQSQLKSTRSKNARSQLKATGTKATPRSRIKTITKLRTTGQLNRDSLTPAPKMSHSYHINFRKVTPNHKEISHQPVRQVEIGDEKERQGSAPAQRTKNTNLRYQEKFRREPENELSLGETSYKTKKMHRKQLLVDGNVRDSRLGKRKRMTQTFKNEPNREFGKTKGKGYRSGWTSSSAIDGDEESINVVAKARMKRVNDQQMLDFIRSEDLRYIYFS